MAEGKSWSYKDAGVDIQAGNEAVSSLKKMVRATYRPEVMGDLGGFGALFALDQKKYKEPVLVSGTDGVGSKLQIAFQLNRHNTIGQDLVAMCVNDVLAQGAEPLFFLDYLAVGKLEPSQVVEIVQGVAGACAESGCSLIGGETAEMPDFYRAGEYDLAGFCVGVAEREGLLPAPTLAAGDVLLGLPSSGLHSNGYSLVRKICEYQNLNFNDNFAELGHTLGEELLIPTRLYPKLLLPWLAKFDIKALVHITGGGFQENLPRALPDSLGIRVETGTWPIPPIMKLIQQWGSVAEAEMFRTFNMGIGLVMFASPSEAEAIKAAAAEQNEAIYQIGVVTDRPKQMVITGVCDE